MSVPLLAVLMMLPGRRQGFGGMACITVSGAPIFKKKNKYNGKSNN